jgi:glycosyltransferase involved in cell wall biosynthesis
MNNYTNKNLVSVITPNYNCVKYLVETIESVRAQTYENWEMIIVDDCSTDESREIAQKYVNKDNRIKLFCLEHRKGAASCRNKGIELSNGEYIAFLDSDDIWNPEKLEKQIEFMIRSKCDFCFTEYEHIDERGDSLRIRAKIIKILTYNKLLFHCFPGCLTVIYKQNINEKIYGPVLKNCDDYALFLQVLKNIKIGMGYSECLAKYRIRTKSLSRNKIKKTKAFFDLMISVEKINIILACFYLFTNQIIKVFWKYKKY